jgi:hypothetical protein
MKKTQFMTFNITDHTNNLPPLPPEDPNRRRIKPHIPSGHVFNINQHEMAWAETDAAYFKVRAKGYRKSRTKEPSAESLYEPIDVATFHFEDVSCHVAPRVFEGAMSPTILRVRERMRR